MAEIVCLSGQFLMLLNSDIDPKIGSRFNSVTMFALKLEFWKKYFFLLHQAIKKKNLDIFFYNIHSNCMASTLSSASHAKKTKKLHDELWNN